MFVAAVSNIFLEIVCFISLRELANIPDFMFIHEFRTPQHSFQHRKVMHTTIKFSFTVIERLLKILDFVK